MLFQGRSRGFGYVQFEDSAATDAAVALSGKLDSLIRGDGGLKRRTSLVYCAHLACTHVSR
jgi:hypothetical protein